MANKRVKVTQLRSGIGFDKKQTLALRGLGLRRLRHTVEVEDTPSVRGLILKVRHLVEVSEAGAGRESGHQAGRESGHQAKR
jgi:large subunit ribosomal protein L30